MESRGSVFVILFVSVFFAFDVYGQVATLCRPNERFLSCGGCQKTCEDPSPVCAAVCREGCYCNEYEVRNSTGHCVKIADCPSVSPANLHTSEPRSSDSSCPDNEEYRFCETCNRTCDNLNPMCPAQCARGCFCKEGLVRDKDGNCVKEEECASRRHENSNYIKPIPYQLTCGPHQLYKDCQKCELTCSSPDPVCAAICNAGCFCEDGYLKAPSGKCVKLQDCPKAEVTMGTHETSVEDCSNEEVYLTCGWCEPSCWDPRPECPPGVCTRGCLCRPPLVRHHSGHCVEDKHCGPQKCTEPGEEFVCRYGCEARCDNRKCPSRPRRCVLGCHCKLGLLRDTDFKCVTLDKCSPRFQIFNNISNFPRSFPVKITNNDPKIFFDLIESYMPQQKFGEQFVPKLKGLPITQPKTKIIDIELSPKAFFEVGYIPRLFKAIASKVEDGGKAKFEAVLSEMKRGDGNVARVLPNKVKHAINTDVFKTKDKDGNIESTTSKPVEVEANANHTGILHSPSSEDAELVEVFKPLLFDITEIFRNSLMSIVPPAPDNATEMNYVL